MSSIRFKQNINYLKLLQLLNKIIPQFSKFNSRYIRNNINSNEILTIKYIPQTFKDIISQEYVINIMKQYIDKNDFPNCILHGPAGIGKTSIARVAINELFNSDDYNCTNILWINASEDRGLDLINETINNFISGSSFSKNKLKIIILDECDNITPKAQMILKNLITDNNIRFCLICNNINKLKENLKSKCLSIQFYSCEYNDIFNKLKSISEEEHIMITDQALKKNIVLHNGDIRAILNSLQYYKYLYYNQIIVEHYITDKIDVQINQITNKILDTDNITNIYQKIKLLCNIENQLYYDPNNKVSLHVLNKYFNEYI